MKGLVDVIAVGTNTSDQSAFSSIDEVVTGPNPVGCASLRPLLPLTLAEHADPAGDRLAVFEAQGGGRAVDLHRAYTIDTVQFQVPEPTTLAIFGLGLAGLGFARRKKAA